MKRSKWLHIFVVVSVVLVLAIGLGGDLPPAKAGPAPAPLLLSSGGVLSIAGTGFVPIHSGIDYDYETWGGVSLAAGSGSPHAMFASVELPSGATVTSLTFFWEDSDAANNMTLYLRRYLRDGTFENMAWASSSGSGGMGNTSDTTISNPVIDNFTYAYALQIIWDDPAGGNLAAYGARVAYSPVTATSLTHSTLSAEGEVQASAEYSAEDGIQPSAEHPVSSNNPETAGVVLESSAESIQFPEEGPVLHTGGEITELASSPPSQAGEDKEGLEAGGFVSATSGSSDLGSLWGESWQYYSVAGDNFHPLYADTTHYWTGGGGRYVTAAGTLPSLVVLLDLPSGATLQEARVRYYDHHATENPTWYLYRVDRQGAGSIIWQATPAGDSTNYVFQTSPNLGEVVDNQSYAYYFVARLSATAGSNLRVQEIALGYSAGGVYLPLILKVH
ncbi:MAG: hypothetical protein JW953_11330 [Anaerolineae bacterium]|nr:hypothetical protein [Anaerolineae bacterium]